MYGFDFGLALAMNGFMPACCCAGGPAASGVPPNPGRRVAAYTYGITASWRAVQDERQLWTRRAVSLTSVRLRESQRSAAVSPLLMPGAQSCAGSRN